MTLVLERGDESRALSSFARQDGRNEPVPAFQVGCVFSKRNFWQTVPAAFCPGRAKLGIFESKQMMRTVLARRETVSDVRARVL